MKTIRPIRPKASGCTRASRARLVIGASGTTVTGSRAAAAASMVSRRRSRADRGSGAASGRHPEVGHPVRRRARGGRRPGPRGAGARRPPRPGRRRARRSRGRAGCCARRPRAGRCRPRRSPRAGRGRVQRGEEEGARVVDTGVDVEDHGEGRLAWGRPHPSPRGCRPPPRHRTRPALASRWTPGGRPLRHALAAPPRDRGGRRHSEVDAGDHVPSCGDLPDDPTPPPPPDRRHDLAGSWPRPRRLLGGPSARPRPRPPRRRAPPPARSASPTTPSRTPPPPACPRRWSR